MKSIRDYDEQNAAALLAGEDGATERKPYVCPDCGVTILRSFEAEGLIWLVGFGDSLTTRPGAKPMALPVERDIRPGEVWTVCPGCERSYWFHTGEAPGRIGVASSRETGAAGRREIPEVLTMEDGAFVFTRPVGTGPKVIASLTAVCPNHNDIGIARWERLDDGTTQVVDLGGWTSQNIADPLPDGADSLFSAPDAQPAPGDDVHGRDVFRCAKATCNYDGQRRSDELSAAITATLDGMAAAGIPRITVASVENAPRWHVVRQ